MGIVSAGILILLAVVIVGTFVSSAVRSLVFTVLGFLPTASRVIISVMIGIGVYQLVPLHLEKKWLDILIYAAVLVPLLWYVMHLKMITYCVTFIGTNVALFLLCFLINKAFGKNLNDLHLAIKLPVTLLLPKIAWLVARFSFYTEREYEDDGWDGLDLVSEEEVYVDHGEFHFGRWLPVQIVFACLVYFVAGIFVCLVLGLNGTWLLVASVLMTAANVLLDLFVVERLNNRINAGREDSAFDGL